MRESGLQRYRRAKIAWDISHLLFEMGTTEPRTILLDWKGIAPTATIPKTFN
jgi:hypothetical protein